jgi:PAS domain-containing protein
MASEVASRGHLRSAIVAGGRCAILRARRAATDPRGMVATRPPDRPDGTSGDELHELTGGSTSGPRTPTEPPRPARERMLPAAVADGLTQGVIAVDSDHRIELLNDAARKMLGHQSPVGEPLIDFVRVPSCSI